MDKQQLLTTIREILGDAGFSVSDPYTIRLPGFDIVARRGTTLLIVKAFANIDGLTEDVATELRTLSMLLKATPLLIGEKNGVGALENDVVYFRFGIQAVTLETFKNHVVENMPVRAYAAPGGLYVNLDPEKIKRLRQEQNISPGMVARHVRVSRRTVSMYEDGMNARIEIANRIEELFEQPVTTPIDLFTFIQQAEVIQPVQREQAPKKDLQSEVFSHLENVGYKVIPMDRCPFEALSKEREKILLTCVQEYNKRLREKAHILSSIARITERYAVVFTDKDVSTKNMEGTPIIMKKELKKIRDPEDVFTLILERSSPE